VPLSLGESTIFCPTALAHSGQHGVGPTIAFAVFQVLAASYAFLFSHSQQNYGLVFRCGAIALVMALIVDLFVREGGSTAADLSIPSTLLVQERSVTHLARRQEIGGGQ